VVGEEKIKDVQLAAVRNLKDQALIAELIDTVRNVNVQKRLIASLKDTEKLMALAGHMDAGIRMAATKHCRDIETLTALATQDTSSGVGMTAVKQLDDDTLLLEIVTRDLDEKVRGY
jgi:predicted regulator of amino acid metabolism with ACT domain